MTTIAIHTYPGALPLRSYLLAQLVEYWRRAGLRVEEVAGIRPVVRAQIGILHVDLTRVPAEYAALGQAYPVLLNDRVLDIGKRLFPDLRVRLDDDYAGPVIVKTDLNTRGIPERIARRAAQRRPARAWGTVLDHLFPRRPTGRIWHRSGMYPVFASKDRIPAWMWRRSDLVVQRFVGERRDSEYAVRYWCFLGDQEYTLVGLFRTPVVTIPTLVRIEAGAPAPPEVRALRAERGFDFGSFNYVHHEGRPVVLDTNKTPGAPSPQAPFPPAEALPVLAKGIEHWL